MIGHSATAAAGQSFSRASFRCAKSQFGRSADYVKAGHRTFCHSNDAPVILGCNRRCLLLVADAHAPMTEADLVTRLGRLKSTIRELTGRIEQLQYRNQQLEQQVQRLQQEEAARGEG